MTNNEIQAGAEVPQSTEAEVLTSSQSIANAVLPACGIEDDEDANEWDVYDECLNCGSTWGPGSEEHDFQQCDACGWMPGEPTDEDSPDDDNDDEIDYEPVS